MTKQKTGKKEYPKTIPIYFFMGFLVILVAELEHSLILGLAALTFFVIFILEGLIYEKSIYPKRRKPRKS
jgi:hypothetical protein